MAKRMQFPTNQFTARYFRITCKMSFSTDFINDMHTIAPEYKFTTDKACRNKQDIVLTFTIPSGTCDSEITIIDNMIDYLFHVYSREEQRVTK